MNYRLERESASQSADTQTLSDDGTNMDAKTAGYEPDDWSNPDDDELDDELRMYGAFVAPPDDVAALGIDVTDRAEIQRLNMRSRFVDYCTNGQKLMNVGPDCRELYPWLVTDPYEYGTLLDSVELREIIASTAMAVLDDANSITTVVGEDTSGRIPALIIGKALNTVRNHNGQEPARRVFMSGRINETHCPAFAARSDDDTAVLITEYVSSGTCANNSLAALRRAGFRDPRLAVLDRGNGVDDGEVVLRADTIYMGDRRSYTRSAESYLFYVDSDLKGVKKRPRLPHSYAAVLNGEQRANLGKMRADIGHFADEIVGMWYVQRQQS